MDFFAYQQSTMLKRVVERDLKFIGEAMSRILTRDLKFEYKVTTSEAIVEPRNHIIHSYDIISNENIGSILTKHLPILKAEVITLIEANGEI